MPTEAELREQFHDDDQPEGRIDLDAVLRRSRARRRPRMIAVAAVSSLAALAIVVPVSVSGALGQTGFFSAASGSPASSRQDAAGQKAPEVAGPAGPGGTGGAVRSGEAVDGVALAQKVNLCTGTLADIAPASNGLVLTVAPVTAAAVARNIPATVTLTNTASTAFRGSGSPFPSVTLSRAGIVLWHSNGAIPSLAQLIELAPGASVSFATTFEPLVCGVQDDAHGRFRADLPPAGPGSYELSAVMAVSAPDGSSVLVSGPGTAVTLR